VIIVNVADALKVANIIAEADGECSICVNRLVVLCKKAWPEHSKIFDTKFDKTEGL
jgi:hypothetical protein